jgi:hypothetical protein
LLGFDFAKHSLVTGTDVDNFVKLGRDIALDSDRAPKLSAAISSAIRTPALPQKLQHTNWKEIGPHLGFAYRR